MSDVERSETCRCGASMTYKGDSPGAASDAIAVWRTGHRCLAPGRIRTDGSTTVGVHLRRHRIHGDRHGEHVVPDEPDRDDMTDSRCTACGQPIWWRLTTAGTRLPLDPHPAAQGTVVVEQHRARVLTGDELPAQQTAYTDHRVTCVRGAAHARRVAATTPRCMACQQPMDPWLVDAGRRHHVLCAPPSRAEIEAAMGRAGAG